MVCQKCQTDIPDGYLYCPNCGEEIIIVNSFDITLEDNIDMTSLSSTTEIPEIKHTVINAMPTQEIIIEHEDLDNADISQDYNKTSERKHKKVTLRISRRLLIFIAFVSVIAIALSIFAAIEISGYFSYDKQLNKAKLEYENGDYASAVSTLKHVTSLKEDNEEASLLLAKAYYNLNNFDAANAVYFELIDKNPDNLGYYDKIIDCYDAEGDNKAINDLIININNPDLLEKYSEYIAKDPVFSFDEGEYTNPDYLAIAAGYDGKIYYTIDGSAPSADSLVYEKAIELPIGVTTVSAIFINNKGIESNVITKTYDVLPANPDPPQISLAGGEYSVPELICVDNIPQGVTVYYTNNNQSPDTDSYDYTMPMLMPIGKSTYKFISINEEGLQSDEVTLDINLKLNAAIEIGVAEYAISYHLLEIGENVLLNTYSAKKAYYDGSRIYYVIDEYTNNKKTGRMFAVDIVTGELFNFSKDTENMSYKVTPM